MVRLSLLVLGLLVGLILAELGLQNMHFPPEVKSGWKSDAHPTEKNQLGFRGRKIAYAEEEFVVVLLGDSGVEAKSCAFGWLPEARLESYLQEQGKQAKVFSLGASGYGQDQQLLALREYLARYRADLVLLWIFPENDIWNNLFPTHGTRLNGHPKPTFWLEDGQLKGPHQQMGERLSSESHLMGLWDQLFPPQRDQAWEAAHLPEPYVPADRHEGPFEETWQLFWDLGLVKQEHLEVEKSHWTLGLAPRSPRMQYGLDLTRQLLLEIERTIKDQGGRLILFWPVPPMAPAYEVGSDVFLLNGKYYRSTGAQRYENLEYLRKGFETLQVQVTLTPWRVGPVNPHLNEHATDQVMRDLAAAITPKIPDERVSND